MNARTRIWVYAGLALAAGVGLVTAASDKASSPNGDAPNLPRGITRADRLFLFGDSLAVGLAPPLRQLATDARIELIADGRTSTRIAQWGPSWLAPSVAARPTIALVSLGTNDMLLADPTVERAALVNLIAYLRSAGVEIVWIMPPTMPFADRGIRPLIAETDVARFPSEALTIPRGPDHIHPTAAGYAGWAGAIWTYLLKFPRVPVVS